jgi:heme a synthase
MGCPDWPKCFGQFIPPTSADQLPDNYKASFVEGRMMKNQRVAKMLSAMGFDQLGQKILNDPSVREEEDFNASRTWTEYVNRLAGVVLGITIMVLFFWALFRFKIDPFAFILSAGLLITVVLQGWLGSVVVSTNLIPNVITVHMILAFVLIMFQTGLYVRNSPGKRVTPTFKVSNTFRALLVLMLTLVCVQVVLGTQVREQIDHLSKATGFHDRSTWIAALDNYFIIHRSFSILLMLGTCFLYYQVNRFIKHYSTIYKWTVIFTVVMFAEVFLGITLAYFEIPSWAQPLHLVLSCVGFGCLSYLLSVVGSGRRIRQLEISAT